MQCSKTRYNKKKLKGTDLFLEVLATHLDSVIHMQQSEKSRTSVKMYFFI